MKLKGRLLKTLEWLQKDIKKEISDFDDESKVTIFWVGVCIGAVITIYILSVVE